MCKLVPIINNRGSKQTNMKTPRRLSTSATLLLALLLTGPPSVRAEGLAEPDLVLYGVIRNSGDHNTRLTEGSLTWRFVAAGGGVPITLSVPLTNLNDQFSYVLRVPCESYIGSQISSNTLKLLTTPILYDRSQISVLVDRTAPAALVSPASPTLLIASADRGRLERVDLVVSLPLIDSDGDGIPDSWELAHGLDPYDPSDALQDYDGDGVNNRAEFRAGTDPNDSESRFEILEVQPIPQGGAEIRWSSVTNKHYTVLRSTDLFSGFTTVQTNVLATPPSNTFRDATPPSGAQFYRLKVEE